MWEGHTKGRECCKIGKALECGDVFVTVHPAITRAVKGIKADKGG